MGSRLIFLPLRELEGDQERLRPTDLVRLQRPVPELAVVAESFHVKPLIRILQLADRYHVLGLNRQQFKLFEGNRDALDEVELDPAVRARPPKCWERSRRKLTLSVWSSAPGAGVHHGMASTAELLDNETNRFFRAVDRDPEALFASPRSLFNLGGAAGKSEFIPANQPQSVPDRRRSDHPSRCVALEALRERMWEVLEPEYLKRLAGLVEMFGAARAKELGTTI
jgi:Bacterial archaeo-eukaryotic release factor family 3